MALGWVDGVVRREGPGADAPSKRGWWDGKGKGGGVAVCLPTALLARTHLEAEGGGAAPAAVGELEVAVRHAAPLERLRPRRHLRTHRAAEGETPPRVHSIK